jgi:hypothetical protein
VADVAYPAVGSARPGNRLPRGRLAGCVAARRSARPAHLSSLARQLARLGQSTAQQELDLGISASQLIAGPPGQGVMDGRIQPQQYAFALAHWVTLPMPCNPPPLDVGDTT